MTNADRSVAAARADYYRDNSLSEPDVARRWEWISIGPVRLPVLNTRARVRALLHHDLHHLATGYGTDLRGEGEQSAWELAAGCHRQLFAWGVNLLGTAIGVVLAPRRTARAFRRGRRGRTLYARPYDSAVLALTVGELRIHLGIEPP